MGRFLRSGGILYIFVLVIIGVLLFNWLGQDNSNVKELNSQEFNQAVDNGAFVIDESAEEPLRQHLQVKDEDQTVSGYLQDGGEFKYAYPEHTEIGTILNDANIPFETDPQNQGFWTQILITVGPILLLVILFIFLFSSMQGGGNRVMSFGKSRAKKMTKDTPQVTFNDVAGAREAVQELTEIKEFLEAPQKFQQLGARIPKGALLVGPPGTGKTLLARAVAGEAGVPFFSISGSDFVEMFVGVGASVTGDTPVLIRDEQGTRLVPISKFVDEHYADGDEDFVVPVNGVETLGYERRESGFRGRLDGFGGSAWKDVRGIYRHKVDEILEIEYLGGTIRTTGDHSVFVRGHGGIKPKAARDLEAGDVLVDLPFKTRRGFIPGLGTEHELRAHRFEGDEPRMLQIEEPDEELTKARDYALANAGTMSQRAIAEEVGVSQATVGNWQSGQHEPRGLSSRYARTEVPSEVALTPSLLKLFGYYTAEGRANGALEFCFGSHEGDLIEDCSGLMREVFGLEPTLEETESNTTRLHYRSSALGRFFASHCGNGSSGKHVPEILWTLSEPYFLAFLEGYSKGDGYTSTEGKLIMTSASHRLIRELSWLCSMHGIKSGIRHAHQDGGRVIRSKPLPDGEYWTLTIGKTSNPFAEGMPTHQHKKPIVRSVTPVPYDGYVYDLCGCDNEAFFGGEKPVLLHNSRVRDLFEQAKQNAPCIIFMDEIDAVGRQRGAGMGGGHDEREQTLNQLLVEMDGFDDKSGIIMIAATNRPDILDPALLRPGRFDRQITVDSPDLMGRDKILNVHARGKPLSDDVNLETIARGTPGFTGADLANLVNEAALLAARHGKDQIEMSEMEEAIDRVIAGPERRTRLISEKEKNITAFHESGHAIVGALTSGADPVHKVTIVPRGQALGVTMSLPEQDRFMMSRKQLTAQLSMMLGGRAAERVIFDEVTTGASNDLERVTQLARQMVTKYGMSEKLGPLSLGSSNQQVFMGRDFGAGQEYSDEIAFQIDQEIRRIVDETYDHAEDLLIRNRELLNKVSSELIEHETVDADHLRRLIHEYAVDRLPGDTEGPSVNGYQEQ